MPTVWTVAERLRKCQIRCCTGGVIFRRLSLGVLWLSLTGVAFLAIDLYT